MNKILGGVLLSLLALSALVLPVHAAGFKAGDTYTLRAGEVFQGNLYAAGGTVDIGGEVRGDLYAAGGTVNVNGAIKGDLVVLGGTVIVNGPVSGDIRVVGGNLMLNSAAEGELVAAGGTINLTSGSKVAGDVAIAGGSVSMEGEIGGKTRLEGGVFSLGGTFRGDVSLRATDHVTFGEQVAIGGNLSYKAPKEAALKDRSMVAGELSYAPFMKDQKEGNAGAARAAFLGFIGFWFVVKLIAMLLIAAVLFTWWTPAFLGSLEVVKEGAGRALLRGFATMILMPIAGIILLMTLIGFPGAVVIGSAYAILFVLASGTAGTLFGTWMERLMKHEGAPTWRTVIGGTILLMLLGFVPVIGWLVSMVTWLMALGGWVSYLRARVMPA
jgi:hypothetical protein